MMTRDGWASASVAAKAARPPRGENQTAVFIVFHPCKGFSSRERSRRQLDPDRCMVGSLVAPAHLLVDRHRLELVSSLRRQEQMVDADAVVLLPGSSLIIPKAVEARSVGGGAQGVDQAERYELTELEPRLRQIESVVDPILRTGRVARVGNDVEIAGQHQGLLVFEELARMDDEPLEERELVRIFLRIHGIAVRKIDAPHPHHAVSGRDDRLDVARLRVVLIARQPARNLERPLGENGDAVECLLTMGFDVVAKLLDLKLRKLLVEALDLLQAKNVGLNLLQVSEEVGQPLADGIDVPGGDAQARGLLELRCADNLAWFGGQRESE